MIIIQCARYDKTQNCFWILITGSVHRIARFNIAKKQITYPLKETVDELLGGTDQIPFFKLDESENLWIANYIGDFCKYNTIENKATRYNILHQRNSEVIGSPNSTIIDCIDDKNGAVWFSGDYYLGLLCYDKKSGNFFSLQNNNGSEYGFHC